MKGSSGSRRAGALVLGAAVCLLASAALGQSLNVTSGVPISGISGAVGSEQFFAIVVPEGQDDLVIRISGGSGDCDLYVRKDAEPTATAYDYRPYKMGSEESVTIESPQAGTWYVMLKGFTDYAGLTLEMTYSSSAVAIPLASGTAMPGLFGAADSEQFYQITVLADPSTLEIGISGGTGDCDLYVRQGALPTTTDYDYRPFLVGNNESVIINDCTPGIWYIMLKGYRAYTDVTLLSVASHTPESRLAHAAVKIAGQGSLRMGGWYPYIYPSEAGIATGLWPDVVAEGVVGGEADDDSASHQMQWMLDYVPGFQTTVTADFAVSLDLSAGKIGDAACAEYWIKLELLSWCGTLIDSDMAHPEPRVVADGAACTEPITVSLSVKTPDHIIDGVNNSLVRLTAYAQAEAFTADPPNDEPVDGVFALISGVPLGGLSGAVASEIYYKIEVPAKQSRLEIATWGGEGDVDLYIRRGAKPTLKTWDYRPHLVGNNETVTINNPKAGTYYIMLKGSQEYSGMTMRALLGASK